MSQDRGFRDRPPARGRLQARPAAGRATVSPGQPAPDARPPRRRPRITGRMAVLVLVLALLAVSYASSMRAYLQQRAHIEDLKSEITAREGSIADLAQEKQRWDDPAYVAQQARERFGYVKPGETPYIVLDENGDPLEPSSTLDDGAPPDPDADLTWWDREWSSVEVAGQPPTEPELPATRIGGRGSEPGGTGGGSSR